MEECLRNKFNGKWVYSFVWKNKICWIGTNIVEIFDYKNISATIAHTITSSLFEVGEEFDVLTGEELKKFKEMAVKVIPKIKHTARLVIFYESGLYGFLYSSQKLEARALQRFVIRDIMTEFRERILGNQVKGMIEKNTENIEYINDDNDVVKYIEVDKSKCRRDLAIDIGRVDTEKMSLEDRGERFKSVVKSLETFKGLIESMNISSEEKLLFYISLFREAGVELDLSFINNI
ncbi:MAG: hypothetical protein ACRC6T_13170 [Sarcina sp.]